jgi:uncharacterized membrane protein
VAVAFWRALQEVSRFMGRTRPFYLVAALIVTGVLLYQGKTGGELVYDHGVGMARIASDVSHNGNSRQQ